MYIDRSYKNSIVEWEETLLSNKIEKLKIVNESLDKVKIK